MLHLGTWRALAVAALLAAMGAGCGGGSDEGGGAGAGGGSAGTGGTAGTGGNGGHAGSGGTGGTTGPTCTDGEKNGTESDVDCGGDSCEPCADGASCGAFDDCRSGVCTEGICVAPACDDAVRNGEESDIDCGGPCDPCAIGGSCNGGSDCETSSCGDGICLPPSCTDGVQNGDEFGVDCGASCAGGCGAGAPCVESDDCESTICVEGLCAPSACDDGVLNGGESSTDCGGPNCLPCGEGLTCNGGSDCESGVCADGLCLAPTCEDGVRNGTESAPDCGGDECDSCADGSTCDAPWDCQSGVCTDGICQVPSCTDGVFNGAETWLDCGGPCAPCPAGGSCGSNADCMSGVCGQWNQCQPPTCRDGVQNGNESALDCGGSCNPCADGTTCNAASDCTSSVCTAGLCQVPACDDGAHNGNETGVDCGGANCNTCEVGAACNTGSDCTTGLCDDHKCVPATCTNGVRDAGESAIDCGGPCGGCANGLACNGPSDCDSSFCDGGICDLPVSCNQLHVRNPAAPSGVYWLQPDPAAAAQQVRCDMTTDGGGWTLVAATAGTTLDDAASGYYADLTSLSPAAAHTGIWSGMRTAIPASSDIRFTCQLFLGDPMAVDLSFYDTGWYREITTGNDAASCFNENNGDGMDPAPARRNNVTGETRPAGDNWNWGYLEGEDFCEDTSDFTVDFDDRGMDSNQGDGTDWGEDDGAPKCGLYGAGAAWFIWVREPQTPSTCAAIHQLDPAAPSGSYWVQPDLAAPPAQVYCDMTTDGGGWTLVASTLASPLNDEASNWYDDLTTLTPAAPHTGIWNGLRAVHGANTDIRFACKAAIADAAMTVDLSFYETPWYRTITTGTDADSCFSPYPGTTAAYARRNNLTGTTLPLGDTWAHGFVGEDTCNDGGDFTVDFDDRGMDSNQYDGTDWGEDDVTPKCGVNDVGAAWFIFVR